MGIFTKKSAQTVAEPQLVPHQSEATPDGEIPPGAIITDEVDEIPLVEQPDVEPASQPEAVESEAVESEVTDPVIADDDATSWLDQEDPQDFTGKKRGFFFVGWRVAKEFMKDQSLDMAAALTYYAVFAIFPAMIAVFSAVGLVSDPQRVIAKIEEVLTPLIRESTLDRVMTVLDGVAASRGAGILAVASIVIALWAASAYVNAFRRMMNRIYGVQEGRALWKLRPLMALVTLVSLALVMLMMLIMIISGPISEAVGKVLGFGEDVAHLWDLLKLPVLLIFLVVSVAILYQATPNVKFPKLRLFSTGSVVAIGAIVVASVGLTFYVRNFANYNQVYGSLAGVIVFMLWMWIINIALLCGAELDAELERGRQLHDGQAAEESLLLPLRDDRAIIKAQTAQEKIYARDRAVREATHGGGDLADRPFTKSR
ncbi:MAG: YihY/virulence factor BrkB family protein [Nocardioidaceae bacterium]